MWFCTRDECNGHRMRFVLFDVNFEIETASFRLLFDRDASHFHMVTRIGCRENWKINVINWRDRQKKIGDFHCDICFIDQFCQCYQIRSVITSQGLLQNGTEKQFIQITKKWWHYELINTNEVVRMSFDLLRISIHQSQWKRSCWT